MPFAKATDEMHVLVLQGGGALGSYQAGVYEGLCADGEPPEWIAGFSIGTINAALIAGNPPELRAARLRIFREKVTTGLQGVPPLPGDRARAWFNEASAALVAGFGTPGFFSPRWPPAMFYPPGAPEALSLYDSAEGHLGGTRRLRSHQCRRDPAERRRRQRPYGQLRLLRQPTRPDTAGAYRDNSAR